MHELLGQRLQRLRLHQRQVCRQDQPAMRLGRGFDGSGNAVTHAGVRAMLHMPWQTAGLNGSQRGLQHGLLTQHRFQLVRSASRSEKALPPAGGKHQHARLRGRDASGRWQIF